MGGKGTGNREGGVSQGRGVGGCQWQPAEVERDTKEGNCPPRHRRAIALRLRWRGWCATQAPEERKAHENERTSRRDVERNEEKDQDNQKNKQGDYTRGRATERLSPFGREREIRN